MEKWKMSTKVIIGSASILLGSLTCLIVYTYVWGVLIAQKDLSAYAKDVLNVQEKIGETEY